ncbi:hypothetical protein [Nonomuraea terrae]|uniref:hypothetical protein n=1 Tax=Nonomuraea terrae TaxID=2530383 RepID=UPI00140435F0|nr:hypothetical protein [Nonomuraea terrae]
MCDRVAQRCGVAISLDHPETEYSYFATIRGILTIPAASDSAARQRLADAVTGGKALDLHHDDPDAEFSASLVLDAEDLQLFEINGKPPSDDVHVTWDPSRAPAPEVLPPGVTVDLYTVTGPPSDNPLEATSRVRIEPYRDFLHGTVSNAWLIRKGLPSDRVVWNYAVGDWVYPEDPDPADFAPSRPGHQASPSHRRAGHSRRSAAGSGDISIPRS